jgi:hypothetical protein
MPHLAIGQQNHRDILALYTVDRYGMLYTPEAVDVEIETEDGTTVFSADQTDHAADTGVYPLWDPDTDAGWEPTDDLETGLYVARWSYLDTDGETSRSFTQSFYIDEQGMELPFWTYVSPYELREEGLCAEDADNKKLLSLIRRVQQYIEHETRQPFRPVARTLQLDGDNSESLLLGVPIIGIEYVKINNSNLELDSSSYRVYNIRTTENASLGYDLDERHQNPKISLNGANRGESPIYWGNGNTDGYSSMVFAAGHQNQEVKGIFGYLEADGTTPELIKYAMKRLIYANAEQLVAGVGGASAVAGPILEETTDRHSIVYGRNAQLSNYGALAMSAEVQQILRKYKAPIALGAPAPRWTW